MNRMLLRTIGVVVCALSILFAATGAAASGGVGIFGIIEKVVFEPSEASPQRLQVWGVFAYVDGRPDGGGAVSAAKQGFLYFKLPSDARLATTMTKEWMDLKSVAGTGQAVGFGAWGYIGGFGGLDPEHTVLHYSSCIPGGATTDMRVRPSSETPGTPAVYQSDIGVVKLSAQGSRADIVRRLQAQVRKP